MRLLTRVFESGSSELAKVKEVPSFVADVVPGEHASIVVTHATGRNGKTPQLDCTWFGKEANDSPFPRPVVLVDTGIRYALASAR